MPFNNYCPIEIQNQSAKNLAQLLGRKLKESTQALAATDEEIEKKYSAPAQPIDQVVYLVREKKGALDIPPGLPETKQPNRTYAKLLLAKSVRDEIKPLFDEINALVTVCGKIENISNSTEFAAEITSKLNQIVEKAQKSKQEIDALVRSALLGDTLNTTFDIKSSLSTFEYFMNQFNSYKRHDDLNHMFNQATQIVQNLQLGLRSYEKSKQTLPQGHLQAEIAKLQKAKIDREKKLEKPPISIDAVSTFLKEAKDLQTPDSMDKGQYARALLANAVHLELQKLASEFIKFDSMTCGIFLSLS